MRRRLPVKASKPQISTRVSLGPIIFDDGHQSEGAHRRTNLDPASLTPAKIVLAGPSPFLARYSLRKRLQSGYSPLYFFERRTPLDHHHHRTSDPFLERAAETLELAHRFYLTRKALIDINSSPLSIRYGEIYAYDAGKGLSAGAGLFRDRCDAFGHIDHAALEPGILGCGALNKEYVCVDSTSKPLSELGYENRTVR
ncbi:hypothetical protein PM082_023192 [Marasmius tenuissimus]|nr:hypothetical protein PM082_023192 [Marasmius tenuissimus]